MFDKLTSVENKYEQLAAEMGDPAVQADNAKFRAHSKAVAEMQPLVEAFRAYKQVITDINENEELLKDPDMRELAQEEKGDPERDDRPDHQARDDRDEVRERHQTST